MASFISTLKVYTNIGPREVTGWLKAQQYLLGHYCLAQLSNLQEILLVPLAARVLHYEEISQNSRKAEMRYQLKKNMTWLQKQQQSRAFPLPGDGNGKACPLVPAQMDLPLRSTVVFECIRESKTHYPNTKKQGNGDEGQVQQHGLSAECHMLPAENAHQPWKKRGLKQQNCRTSVASASASQAAPTSLHPFRGR